MGGHDAEAQLRDDDGVDMGGELRTGTTIMAACFDGGVILGADSRTTTGTYVANRVTDKITPLCDNVFILRSGSAAATQAISANVQHMIREHSIMLGTPGVVNVKTAAQMVMQISYQNKNALEAGMIVAGWDEVEGGVIYGIPLGGSLIKSPFTIGGSGSAYIYAWCDHAFKPGFSRSQCEAFVEKAVALAMARDGSSGGCVRMCCVSTGGVVEKKVTVGDKTLQGHGDLPHPPSALATA
mmetsp:Transcript_16387/g.53529  ORF Transcript_16387/g.53529 Transcript_16387/m.53529 type:complete len:240 (+) Transcript_16387:78-797(+)